MSSTKSQVAVATNIPNLQSGQQQKDYNSEESLGRQNSFGLNRRGNMKGKHLTRSHAMREATSPPRTPTPRASESSSQVSPNGYQQHQQHMDVSENNNNNSNNKLHTQSSATRGNSPIIDTPTVIVTSQHKQQQQQQSNVALCNETEFPKLSPPKSKSGSNSSGCGGSGNGSGCIGNAGISNNSSSSGVNNSNCNNNNQQRINNTPENHNNNNNSNKKTSGDTSVVNETHNKSTNNVNMNAGNTNKSYNNQSQQQQQFNAGSALQKALNVSDNTQATPIYNSPMNYQLHSSDVNREHQQQQQQHIQLQQPQQSFIVYEKENRCPRNDSQNSMNSNDEIHYETQQQQHQQQQQQQQHHQQHQRSGGGGKKHRTNSNSKSSKPRLKNMSSTNSGTGGGGNVSNMGAGGNVVAGGITSGSIEGSLNSSNNTSGFISRVFTNSENSNEQYTDYGGTDLLSFFKETLNKNVKDRQFLLKVEKDLIEFVQEGNRGEIRFPQASSYNRMLIHRTAAFFGMEHNVDTETQQCVIVAPTKNTRIPDIRFKTLVINNRDDSRKSILKRDTHSFDEARQSSYLCPDRGGMLDRKAKSFEEREEDYDRARSRIFNRSQNESCPGGGGSTEDDNNYIGWTSSVDQQQQFQRGRSNGKVLKIQNSPDGRTGSGVQKTNNNFGNYSASNQGGAPLIRGDSTSSNKSMGAGSGNGTRIFSKQDSAGSSNTSWRLSPSSSGYKTQTQSIRSDSVTPSPTGGYGSDETHLADHPSDIVKRDINEDATSIPSGLVWAVTDISNVPKGSILINPKTLQPILNADGTVYHYDPSNMPPTQAMTSCGNVTNTGATIYHTNQNNSPQQQQQLSVHNSIKKQHKGHQIQQQSPQQFNNKLESTNTGTTYTSGESVSESSTQTINIGEEVNQSNSMLDISCQEGDLCNQDENDECDNSTNGCLSITTTTSTKTYDRIEVQKFKNQATSPNIPISEKDDIVKREHSSQTPNRATPTQQTLSQTPQQSQSQNRETPHSSRSTPFSNSDTLTKRSSEEPRGTSWTQSYQAPDGSTVFHTTTPNSSTNNPYCTTTYQQGPDGSIYAVPQGMIYAYPPPVEGEFQGYFMPVFEPSQQRSDTTGLLQPGTQAIYPASGATTMVPVAAYPTAQFATTNGAPIYPSQVIYSGEQFQTAATPITATAPASATAQLQQIPMTTYPIGYPYPYNGYWGQTMTYYVPQQAVPATSLLAAPAPPQAPPGNGGHVAGGVNTTTPNGGSSTAGPSTNSSNNTSNSSGHSGNSSGSNTNHQNGSATTGYQTNVHTIGGGGFGVGSSHSGGTTYYGTGRIKRPPSHFGSTGANGSHQVLTASMPNGVTTATYQLGHAVPTLTLAAAAPPQATAGSQAATDLSGGNGAPTTTTMYALPQHATIFPANMFPYANATTPAIGPQSATNIAHQTAIIQPAGNPQTHIAASAGGQGSTTAGAIHNPHHSNTVITPFYTTTHHHAPHPGIQSGGHTIHAPGPSAIPIVDPTTIANVAQIGSVNNSLYGGRGGTAVNTIGTSQSAPSTPLSMPSSSTLHHSQRNSSVFSTPPILNNNSGNYNSTNSTPQYYGNTEISHQSSVNTSAANNSNSPHNSYASSSYEKRNNTNSGGSNNKKPLSYQSASLSRQNSTSGNGYNGNSKPSALLNNTNNNNNNDTRASPSSSTNSRPHSIKRGGGPNANNDKPQNPLLSGPPSFVGAANIQTINNNSYQAATNSEIGTGNIPIVNVSKPPIRLNASAAAFRQKSTAASGSNSAIEYRRNTASQRNSPGTNASSNENSNNNSPNSIHNSSNAATPIAAGCYAPSYMITAQNNGGEPAPTHPPSLYITTAPARGPAHIPPHLQPAAANGAAVPAAAAAATASVPQQTATAVLGGAAAAAAAADVANAAAVAAAAATVAHHHHHQPLLGTYNPGTSGLYFKYGHTYFAHPSVALPNSRRSPSTDLRPPIAQMAGMYPTVNMMIPAQPRHPGRHPNPNYKGTRPR